MTRHRKSTKKTSGLVQGATLIPLALGLAANSPAIKPLNVSAATGVDASAMTSTKLIGADKAIPRVNLSNPASEVLDTWEHPLANKSHYGSCGWFGSDGADKETNHRKNRTDLPTRYHTVEFAALTDLDLPHGASTRRDKWTSTELDVIKPYEGEALTVTGFIAAFRPQANNTEATNCGESGEDSTDWHIALVGNFGDPEPEAVVVKTTPRIKYSHPTWIPANLKPFVGKPDSIRVSGYLLLDPVHKGHLGKYRRTLSEIHPIHRIEYWQNGVWRDLDDIAP
jgi:hypothetical protein